MTPADPVLAVMDDNERTDKTLDALADLFLTGSSASDGAVAGTGSLRPVWAQHREASKQLVAPGPIRMAPKPAARVRRGRAAEAEAGDAEAVAGVIGDFSARDVAAPSVSRTHLVEAVFLGNLPGFGAPWLTQYAHRLAQRHGPVAVLHLDDEQIDLEVVATVDDPSLPPHTSIFIHRGEACGEELLDCLHDLSQLDPSAVRAWLIHIPGPLSGSMLAKAYEVPRWTVLCGADEAAVVSAYQHLKKLLGEDSARDQRRVGMMVMGCDQEAARSAQRKLNAAAGSFLHTPIGLVGSQQQMVPVARRVLGTFTGSDQLWPSVRAFMETMQGRALPDAEQSIDPGYTRSGRQSSSVHAGEDPIELEAPRTATDTGEEDVATGASSLRGPVDDAGEAAAWSADMMRDSGALDTSPPPEAPEAPEAPELPETSQSQHPPESQQPTAARTPPQVRPDLGVYLPGALGLEAHCPRHPEHHLMIDQDGRLHLMGRCDTDGEGMDSLRSEIMGLIETRTWATEHLELLKLTQRQCRFDPQAEPVLHLFTNDAKAAARMVGAGAPPVRLHLLRLVQVGQQQTWFCTELN